MTAQDQVESATFEELLVKLDTSLERLESSSLTLDESIGEYEKAVQLAAAASAMLEQAELRITEIGARLDTATMAVQSDDEEPDWHE